MAKQGHVSEQRLSHSFLSNEKMINMPLQPLYCMLCEKVGV